MNIGIWRNCTIACMTSSVLVLGSGLFNGQALAAPARSLQAQTEAVVPKSDSGLKNSSQDPYVNGGPYSSDASGTR